MHIIISQICFLLIDLLYIHKILKMGFSHHQNIEAKCKLASVDKSKTHDVRVNEVCIAESHYIPGIKSTGPFKEKRCDIIPSNRQFRTRDGEFPSFDLDT
jgi:hypothetical protein